MDLREDFEINPLLELPVDATNDNKPKRRARKQRIKNNELRELPLNAVEPSKHNRKQRRDNFTKYQDAKIGDIFEVKIEDKKQNDNFNITNILYNINFKKNITINAVGLYNFQRVFTDAIQNIIDEEKVTDNDTVQVSFAIADNDYISTKTIRYGEIINLKKFLFAQFAKVIQSNREIYFNDILKIRLKIIRTPQGGKGSLGASARDNIKNKKSIVEIKNTDNLCFERALLVCYYNITDDEKSYTNMRKVMTFQTCKAKELREKVNIVDSDKMVSYMDAKHYEDELKVNINFVEPHNGNFIVKSNNKYERNVFLMFFENHFNAIVNIRGYMGGAYFCQICMIKYNQKEKHTCNKYCKLCNTPDCEKKGNFKKCDDCGKNYYENKCFELHKKNRCAKYCKLCKCKNLKGHICGKKKCPNCKIQVDSTHKCYIQQKPLKESSEKYVFFDFECTQDGPDREHVVNYVCAIDFNDITYRFYNLNKFCSWAISEKFNNYTFIAHNGRGYDFQFIQNWAVNEGYKIGADFKAVSNGCKLMLMQFRKFQIRFIDSISFMTLPLRVLPATFDIDECKKGYFPHFFNTKQNQNYIGKIPPREYYGVAHFSKKELDKFDVWYDENKNKTFDFKKEMAEYCYSDVDVLRKTCIKFRQLYLDAVDVDPFQYTTIPSTCMAIFKAKFMQPNSIAIVEPYSIEKNSIKATAWLEYMSALNNIKIQHANNGKEYSFKHDGKLIKVDGYCTENKTCYQFHGCVWHGCPRCTKPEHFNLRNKKSYKLLYSNTKKTDKAIKDAGYNLVTIWECEFNELLKEEKRSKFQFADFDKIESALIDMDVVNKINPRDAMFGGRTNAFKLLYKFKPNEIGHYVDFTSLYPTVMFYDMYPVGHYKLLERVNYSGQFGVVQCKILAPRGLYIPVLPYRAKSGKLTFPLCGKCADEQINKCNHTDNERVIVGTWISLELDLALKKGYKILKTYQIMHWDEKSDEIFKDYIRTFMKIKEESSGWPVWCKNDDDKYKYIDDTEKKYGFKMEYNNICKNNGKREIAKLSLNSLWGKFGQQTNKINTEYITDRNKWFKIIRDSNLEVHDFDEINEKIASISYRKKDELADDDYNTNIIIAAFTTAHSRIRLYNVLDYLGDQVLYFDTDSIIYKFDHENKEHKLVETGPGLGNLKDELEGDYMTNYFVSSGPKSYSYMTKSGKICCKIKGFTLNFENSKKLNYKSLISIVRGDLQHVKLKNESAIVRDKKNFKVKSVEQEKDFSATYDKRIINIINQDNYDTLPYGY